MRAEDLSGSAAPSNKQKHVESGILPGSRLRWEPIDLPDGATPGRLGTTASEYLRGRGFDPAWLLGLGYCDWPAQESIIIPYFDDIGELIFLASHSYTGRVPKYLYPKGPKPLYVPVRRPEKEVAVIVEGQLDAAMVAYAGYKAIAIGGKYLAAHVVEDLVEEIGGRGCVVVLDGDAGAEPVLHIWETLIDHGVCCAPKWLPEDEDPASIGAGRIEELIG